MEKGKLIAGILKLTEGVGCDDGGSAAVNNVLTDKLFDIVSHNGVKSVKGFVTEQISRSAGKPQKDGNLLLDRLMLPDRTYVIKVWESATCFSFSDGLGIPS